jgi:GT2 family glycosyltransferase
MDSLPLISTVIPAYNPESFLLEAVVSVERQTWPSWEIVVVDDGTDRPDSLELLASLESRNDPRIRLVRQENRGLAAARNTGFREARGQFVVPLDADDLLAPKMMRTCHEALARRPDCAFAYFDYRVFGDSNYLQQPGEYNVYRLLNENFMACCCFLPKTVWEQVGGYDEWHRWGYEDWSFYLSLAKHGKFGLYIPEPLFHYRTHGRGLHYTGLERHDSNWARMEQVHPELLSPEGRLRTKRAWAPSVCVVSSGPPPDLSNQTLQDYQLLQAADEATILERSTAEAFLWLAGGGALAAHGAGGDAMESAPSRLGDVEGHRRRAPALVKELRRTAGRGAAGAGLAGAQAGRRGASPALELSHRAHLIGNVLGRHAAGAVAGPGRSRAAGFLGAASPTSGER